jgi:oligopeptidase B
VPENDAGPPWRQDPFEYQVRYRPGADYPVLVRQDGQAGATPDVLIDFSVLAAGHALFAVETIRVAPGHRRIAYAADWTGRREFRIAVRDLGTGRDLPDVVGGADSCLAWDADGGSLYYVGLEPHTLRPFEVRRHVPGTDPAGDPVLFTQRDPAFRCLLTRSRSGQFVVLTSFSCDRESVHVFDFQRPDAGFVPVCPPQRGWEYELDHGGGAVVVRSNFGSADFRVCEIASWHAAPESWRVVVPPQADVFIERMAAFRGHLVLGERCAGRPRLRVIDRATGASHPVTFPEAAYELWIEMNPEAATSTVRVGYTSLVTPVRYYDYDMASRDLRIVHREVVPGYMPDAYVTARQWATSHDGTRVPITLAWRPDRVCGRPAPLLLFVYGAYGTNIPPYFDPARAVLLDCGFVYGMAHVRGGSELGRAWYLDGRLAAKWNSICDFIACVEHLVANGTARHDAVFAETLSAGGLVVGAALNTRPELFRGVVARFPFVDLLTTMSDPSLPLTQSEYEEWGDPRHPEQWHVMRSYSPYDNVTAQAYPHIFAVASRHDAQVPCWEPAKWVARVRGANTAPTHVLLRTFMDAGHSGPSRRSQRLCDLADAYTFLLSLAADSAAAAASGP